jgi:putative membrane protein
MFDIVKGVCKWKSNQLRLWNELATLFLVAIVFLVVLKSSINWVYGTLGFFGVALSLMIAIQIYKKMRIKK